MLFITLFSFAYGAEVFRIMGPGLLVTGPVVIISQLASHFAEEKESGTLQRLITTPVSRETILLSGLASQLVVGIIQIAILFAASSLLGMTFHDNASVGLLFMIPFLVTFTSLGFGLILASFIKNAGSAGGLAWFIILPLQFLGGSFSDEPILDFLPTSLAVDAMKEAMILGNVTFEAIGLNLILIAIWGIVGILIGIAMFQRKTAIL
jgi:ABC-2 type transport system permease protein